MVLVGTEPSRNTLRRVLLFLPYDPLRFSLWTSPVPSLGGGVSSDGAAEMDAAQIARPAERTWDVSAPRQMH